MKYNAEKLKKFGIELMGKAGLGEKEADVFADSLVQADLRGIGSHGVSRFRTYATRVKSGVVAANVVPEIISGSDSVLAVDGKNGIGTSVAMQVMDMCIERAKKQGSCFATVKNGNHFGIGAYYTMYAAKHNMIGVAMCNSEASVVPTGGAKPMLGTNPLSVAIPAGRYPSFVLDMATSVVARGKVVLAQKEGKSIPDSWCVDKDGAPTTDPSEALAGAMLPFGGPKGYAIGFIIDIICSCLGGALDCRRTYPFWTDFENPQNVGYFMGVFDISKLMPVELFKERVDSMFDEFKACPTSPGFKEVMIPGEIEYNLSLKREQEGIEISDAVVEDIKRLAKEYDLEHPFN
ncbi:MAG: Ldh family oxidoreductase [Clostridia bacterium]